MAKKNPANEKDKTTASAAAKLPAYLQGYPGLSGTENWGPEDVVWVGEEFLWGDADRQRDVKFDQIAREIFRPEYALRRILLEIIRNHPIKNEKATDEARLDTALAALLGADAIMIPKSITKSRGGRKPLLNDEAFLEVMAREYLNDIYGFSGGRRSISELIRVALDEVCPKWKELDSKEPEAIQRRLARKFEPEDDVRDKVMIEYTGRRDYDHRRYIDLSNKVILYLAALGLTRPNEGRGGQN